MILLPAALVCWAIAAEPAVDLPAPRWPLAGWSLATACLLLMLEAMRELWFVGGGLPMNAYPPVRLVKSGVYSIVPHPIYVGFCGLAIGVALATGSRAGLWLVCPTVIAGCVALLMGYEVPAMRKRFGPDLARPAVRAPDDGDGPIELRDRLAALLLLFLPWVLLYEGWGHAQPAGLIAPGFPGEASWPVIPWTTFIYTLAYPFTLGVPFLLRHRRDLRAFFVGGWVLTICAMLSYLVFPVQSPPRSFDAEAIGGWLLRLERTDQMNGAVACPSFHVLWAVFAALAYGRNGRTWGIVAWPLAVVISASCVTTGMHRVVDIAVAVPLAVACWHGRALWRGALRVCERVANGWSCVRLGPIRVISYAKYAALSAAAGVLVSASLAGERYVVAIVVVGLASLVGGGLWGQALVGSPTLLRPFGYFGSVLGAGLALIGLSFAHGASAAWLVAGAMAVAAPWIVAIGRLRCLVQGCCHGSPTAGGPGIRYRHPMSRACRIAGLEGTEVHPTPVYSMAANVVIGLSLARLWFSGSSLALILGVYLLLAGMTRFVEESRRGEPQTQMIAGLRIYQWFALLSVLAGGLVTCLSAPTSPATMAASWQAVVAALLLGAVFGAAMGVDFPDSNRRFSRLA